MVELRYEERSVQRIVVALDESEGSRQALEEAARLAAALQVELVGLFVEDVTYLEAAALPVTQALSATARGPLHMAPDLMERAFRVHADRLRSRFMEASSRWGLRASFQTMRGIIPEQLAAQLAKGDLVALGRSGRRHTNHRIVGSTAQAMAERSDCPVLLLAGPLSANAPALAIYEGSLRVLDIAADLARCYDLTMNVVALGDGGMDELRKQAEAWCAEHQFAVTVSAVDGSTDAEVFKVLSAQMASIAIIDGQGVVAKRLGLRNILSHIDGPVLVVP